MRNSAIALKNLGVIILKNFNKKFYAILGIFFILWLFSTLFIRLSGNQLNYQDRAEVPKTSQTLNIITPENKTYGVPMDGYFPGTFGFENDKLGESQPMLFSNIYQGDSNGSVIEELDGHKKIFNITDNDPGVAMILQKFSDAGFENQTYGTIEYWFRVQPGNNLQNTEIRLHWDHNPSSAAINIRVYGALQQWQYWSGAWIQIPNIPDPSNNTWHHIRIQFRCLGADSYLGLNENQFEIVIDGISSGSLDFSQSATEIAMFEPTHTQPSGYLDNYNYIDAIGYSWDPNYNIGDNLDEGLLLHFETDVNFDWIGYSLDQSTNKTILGNTTICYPTNGLHSIQIFENDSVGTLYSSGLRYFSVEEPIILLTPEEKTYSEPMRGYYPATYGFECDEDGEQPKGWIIQYNAGTIEVISELNHSKKILRLNDSDGGIPSRIYNNFTSKDNGTIEFWIQQDELGNDGHRGQITGYGNGLELFRVKMVGPKDNDSAKWQVRDDGADINITGAPTPQNRTWYHIRIDFEHTIGAYEGLGQNQYYVWINGVPYGPYNFTNNEALDQIFLHTYSYGENYSTYYDALGYSWDPNYNIGDNLEEGLLLTYENYTNIDWIGYSLDGNMNKTISGNTSIKFPDEGLHTIQIFCNNTQGKAFQTDICNFVIDSTLPTININSPIDFIFFGASSPSYQISYTEDNLDSMWYYLGPGTNIVLFVGTDGTINQTEWDKLESGLVSIIFYINDTGGLENYDEVTIYKDTIPPFSNIEYTPYRDPNIVSVSTTFLIIYSDPLGFEVNVRYKIDNSAWFNYTGPFNLSGYAYGEHLITYHAIDAVGNIEAEHTLTVILTDISAGIPGYSLLLILGLMGIISILLIRKYYKNHIIF